VVFVVLYIKWCGFGVVLVWFWCGFPDVCKLLKNPPKILGGSGKKEI